MSVIGPGSMPALGLAAAAAASQQRTADLADRDVAEQATQKLQADEVRLGERDLDDSIETEFSHGQVSDRDSDGHLPWQQPEGNEQPADEEPPKPAGRDSQEFRGRILDIDA